MSKYFFKTHITGTCDAVVIAVSPAAAVGHTSVLALNHTICVKHRRTITIMDVLIPVKDLLLFRKAQGTDKWGEIWSFSHLCMQGSMSLEG